MSNPNEDAAVAATIGGQRTLLGEEEIQSEGRRWGMVVDADLCTGCQACVVACYSENNIAISEEDRVAEGRAKTWIRIERYWEGEFPNAKARFVPVLCQHCDNAGCESVCPVFATYHNDEGLNAQVYNRCIGTRFCANGCIYSARYFNFWEPEWPEPLDYQLNPDVTVRSKGIIEKCTFCVQRITRAKTEAAHNQEDLKDGDVQPACVQACPTSALVFGDMNDDSSKVSQAANSDRGFKLLEKSGFEPGVVYLAKIDPFAEPGESTHTNGHHTHE